MKSTWLMLSWMLGFLLCSTGVALPAAQPWDPGTVIAEAMRWKRMFEDPQYIKDHLEEFRQGQKRFVERYPGAKEEDYKGYISGFYPVEKDGKFLPLTGVGCSRFVWAIFKTCYPERHFEFLNTGSMYDIILVTLEHPAGTDREVLRRALEARLQKKAPLLKEGPEWIATTMRHLDVFTPIRDPKDVKPGDLAVWVGGTQLVEKGHVGIVTDPARLEFISASSADSGIIVENYTASSGPGQPGAFFLRWNGVAPVPPTSAQKR